MKIILLILVRRENLVLQDGDERRPNPGFPGFQCISE
jgi:hypothetical protein